MGFITNSQLKSVQQALVDNLKNGKLVPGQSVTAKTLEPISEESGVIQDEPFVIQGTGTANGTASVDVGSIAKQLEKQGNSVVYNQKINKNELIATKTVSDVKFTNNGDGSITLNGTATAAVYQSIRTTSTLNITIGHKYLVLWLNNAVSGLSMFLNIDNAGRSITKDYLFDNAINNSTYHEIRITNGTTLSNVKIKPLFIDLTQWFNGNDNIPQEILDDPKKFYNYYSGSFAYNAGTLTNGTGEYLLNTHRNQWDEVWEVGSIDWTTGQPTSASNRIRTKNYIKIAPNCNYYCKCDYYSGNVNLVIAEYDINKKYLGYQNIINYESGGIPANIYKPKPAACYIKFATVAGYGATYANDITISLYYLSGEGYDKYYPYEAPSVYDTGNEILRSAGSVRDIKKPDGTITRYVGSVDLGTLSWAEDTLAGKKIFKAYVSGGIGASTTSEIADICCPIYTTVASTDLVAGDKRIRAIYVAVGYECQIAIYDPKYTDAATFKAAMSGVYLNYELLTPTTEQGTPFPENIEVDDYGTMGWLEEYDATDFSNNVYSAVPQGCKIFYPADIGLFIDTLGQREDIEWDANEIVSETQLNAVKTGIENGNISAGHADTAASLDTDLGVADETPYAYQTAGGSSDIETGMQKLEKLVGCKLVKNQLWQPEPTHTAYNIICTNNNDGTVTLNGTASDGGSLGTGKTISTIQNHQYLIFENSNYFKNGHTLYLTIRGNEAISDNAIVTANSSGNKTVSARTDVNEVFSSQKLNTKVIDLTQMFGSNTIVDAIIGSDTSKQVANLLSFLGGWLPTDYDEGSFTECKSAKLKTVDYNQLDNTQFVKGRVDNGVVGYASDTTAMTITETGVSFTTSIEYRGVASNLIRVKPNCIYELYYLTSYSLGRYVDVYDYNGNWIERLSLTGIADNSRFHFTTPINCSYVRISFQTYTQLNVSINDISLFLYWDGSRIGYEPYKEHPYDLPNQDLNGILVLSGGKVVASGDELYPDGTGSKKYGIVDLGTLTWQMTTNYANAFFYENGLAKSDAKFICLKYTKYTNSNATSFGNNAPNLSIASNNNGSQIFIRDDSYTTAEAFKTAMSGVYLIYELATPEALTGTAFTENIYVDDFGTMQFLDEDDNQIVGLQGNKIFYKANIAGFAESLYAEVDGDPDEFVVQEDLVGYNKTEDLSSSITDVAGLTYNVKKAYKIGKVVILTISARNSTGSNIAAGNTLFTLDSSLRVGASMVSYGDINSSPVRFVMNTNGTCVLGSNLPNDQVLYMTTAYCML